MSHSIPESGLRDRLVAAPASLRQQIMVEFIIERLKEALGVDDGEADEINARARFEALGIDSKRALEFKEFLEQEFGEALRTTLMFDYPTPQSLGAYLIDRFFGSDRPADAGAPSAPPRASTAASNENDEDWTKRMHKKLENYDL